MAIEPDPYQAALYGVAFHVIPAGGYLRLSGDDRVAFLQRQTTNDIRLAQAGQTILTVLTTPTARILDVLYVLPEEATLGLITLPGRGESTARYFKSRIFFMDKVTLVDFSAELVQLDLVGPGAPALLGRLGIDSGLRSSQVISGVFADVPFQVLAHEPAFGLGVRLLAPAGDAEALQDELTAAGAFRLSDEGYAILRIEAGLPSAGAELSEDYTPLEAGLQPAISSTKGCYTGQEVVARQLTYDKVAQHLCGLRLEQPARPGERLWAADGSPAGKVTSAVKSPRFGEIALAVARRPYHQVGQILRVGETFEAAGQARVVSLPFSSA
jgi:folate-binding protein YgfZ